LFISLIRTSWHIGIFFVLDHPLIGVCDLFISNLLSQALIVYLTKKSGSILPAATTHAITLFEPMFLTYSDEFYNANIIPMNLVGQISTLIVGGFCYYLMFKENLIKKKE
jgi:membrane protease YdiL (CAAX protease family)